MDRGWTNQGYAIDHCTPIKVLPPIIGRDKRRGLYTECAPVGCVIKRNKRPRCFLLAHGLRHADNVERPLMTQSGRRQILARPAAAAPRRRAADRVKTLCQIDDAVGRHQPVRGTDPVNPAIARRQPHRAAAIGAEREIDQTSGHRGCITA
jgi:hypothetical protein